MNVLRIAFEFKWENYSNKNFNLIEKFDQIKVFSGRTQISFGEIFTQNGKIKKVSVFHLLGETFLIGNTAQLCSNKGDTCVHSSTPPNRNH